MGTSTNRRPRWVTLGLAVVAASVMLGIFGLGGGSSADAQTAFSVVSTDPANGAVLNSFPTTITVNFNADVFEDTVHPGDLEVNGVQTTGVTIVDGDTLVFEVDPAADIGNGFYSVALPAGDVVGGPEAPNDLYEGGFTVEAPVTVCVSKFVGVLAESDGFEAADFAVVVTAEGVAGPVGSKPFDSALGPGCFLGQGQEPSMGDAEFVLLPGMQVTIAESMTNPAKAAGAVGPTQIRCFVPSGQGVDLVTGDLATGSVQFTVPTESSSCEFFNDSRLVCVSKELGQNASALTMPGSSRFDIVVNGVARDAQLAPVPQDQFCVARPGGGAASFFVAPGAQFTITEAVTTAGIGPTFISCSVVAPIIPDGPSGPPPRQVGGDLASRSVTVQLLPDEPLAECSFVNGTIPICVAKEFGSGAVALRSSADSFSFTMNGGQPQPLGDGCGDGSPAVEFFAAPGETVTIAEIAPEFPPVRPTEIVCLQEQGEGQPLPVGTADLGQGQIVIQTSANELGAINCVFTNDALIVCVTKALNDPAFEVSMPGDYPITLTASGQAPVVQQPAAGNELCGQASQFGTGIAGFALPPGSTFSVSEDDPGAQVALTTAECFAEVGVVALAPLAAVNGTGVPVGTPNLSTWSVDGISSLRPDGAGRIDCTFVNEGVFICVTKQIGKTADEAGVTDLGTFDAFANGTQVLDDQAPFVGNEGDICANGDDERFGFVSAPGASVSLVESMPAGSPSRLVDAVCRHSTEVDVASVLTSTTLDLTVPTDANSVECTLTNDVAIVCVTKSMTEDAFFVAGERADGFTFTLTVEGSPIEPTPDVCENFGSNGGGSHLTGFVVPPDATVVLTEDEPTGVARLLSASCQQAETTVEADLASRSVEFTVIEPDVVNCTFVNGVSLVCVVKVLGPNAESLGATTDQFEFAVTSDPAAVASDEACGVSGNGNGNERRVAADATGTLFVIAPGSSFTLSESTVSGVPTGMIDGSCTSFAVQLLSQVDLDAETVTVDSGDGAGFIECTVTNETVIMCVTKEFTPNSVAAVNAGVVAVDDFSFQLSVDGEPSGDLVVAGEGSEMCPAPDFSPSGVATILSKPGSTYMVSELVADGVPSVAHFSRCNGTSGEDPSSVTFSPAVAQENDLVAVAVENPYRFECIFVNDSLQVTINKTLITDDGLEGVSVADFLFDVYDSDGAALHQGLSAGAAFWVAPGDTFTITERSAPLFTTTASCVDSRALGQALSPQQASVIHTPGAEATSVECTFVNDDIPPIPVCAMLLFEEGTTDFTLADFSLELFKDGAIVGQETADGEFDAACDVVTEGSASLLPGALIQLAAVRPIGDTYSFAVSVADPDDLIEFEPSSCTVDGAAAVQALDGPAAAAFTVDPGATGVTCVVRANVRPPVTTTGGSVLLPFIEPEAASAAAAPVVAVAAPVQVIGTSIAVTGSSTTGLTAPIGFMLLAGGFVGLGLGRHRRRRLTNDAS